MWEQFLQEGALFGSREGDVILGFPPFEWRETPSAFSFYASDFFLENKKPFLQPKEIVRMRKEQFLQQVPPQISVEPLSWVMDSDELFQKHFANLQQKIKNGILVKGVPYSAVRANQPISASHLSHFFSRYAQSSATLFGFWNAHEGIIGLTPERLFKKSGSKIESEAIAGTMSRSHLSVEAFLNDPKEQKEHAIVVNAICDSLEAYGQVKVAPTEALHLRVLVHQRTGITLEGDVGVETLIHALHPTPAIGAFPKTAGLEWLKEVAVDIPRGRFGAPFGWVEEDFAEIVVAIRAIQWDTAGSRIFAGAGVVAESVVVNEWNEIKRKIESVSNGY